MARAFLDCASAAPLREEVKATVAAWLAITQADPGRGYEEALVVRRAIEEARAAVGKRAGRKRRLSGGARAAGIAKRFDHIF